MEDRITRNTNRVGDYDVYSPCYFLREAVSAIFKCLGVESKPDINDNIINNSNSSSCSKEKEKNDQSPSSDPPSTIMDPADDPPMEELATRGRTPPRPGISTGRDPQTNTSPSQSFTSMLFACI